MSSNVFQSNDGRSKRARASVIAAASLMLSAAGTNAAVYNQVTNLAALQGSTGGTTLVSASLDGSTAYGFFNNPLISKEASADTAPSTTTLTSSAAYLAASGATSGGSGILWNSNSSTLIIADNTSHSIVKIDKTSGTPTTYYTTAQIKAVTGDTGNPSLSESAVTSSGELDVYDASSITADKGIYTTAGGSFTSLISNAALTTGMGNNTVSAFTVAGNEIVIGNTTSHEVFGYNTLTSTFSVLLTAAQIAAVNGTAAESFTPTGFYYAPDGNVYYDEANSTTNKDIMEFNPSDPADTLRVVYTGAQLLAGPADATLVSNFTFYNGQIAWTEASTSGVQVAGIYSAVPEPTSAALIFAGTGLLSLRRRRTSAR